MPITLIPLSKAVKALKQALEMPKSDIVRDATIQRFEFCIELSWKSAKKIMGTTTSAPKQVVREMGQNGFIDDVSLWIDAIDNRNLSVHTYNEELANKIYDFIKSFAPEFEKLLGELEE